MFIKKLQRDGLKKIITTKIFSKQKKMGFDKIKTISIEKKPNQNKRISHTRQRSEIVQKNYEKRDSSIKPFSIVSLQKNVKSKNLINKKALDNKRQ